MTEPLIAFRVRERDETALEVRVNFGMFAGRNATNAEIDDLASTLQDIVGAFAVVAEERHEFGGSVEATLRQIVIEIGRGDVGDDVDMLCERVVARAEQWASTCIKSRSELGELGSEI